MRRIIKLGLLSAIGYFLYSKFSTANHAVEDDRGPVGSSGVVRNAGPEDQSGIHNDDWDPLDEQIDESFPASDPPGSY
ncbi:hypothetical protein EDF56_1137 [Novosphingobium sp. PhB165]|uniref:hypothetical protein n=1 Tax=Novosphingobium sp. PhB165 TaxID=2485105 RepID=UPI00105240D0|nr:hypothetical protein [Novosphingobium sp. PhB165]TCM14362.1 hypothetical protein EDF56_1137 [Novosphingobium sp. PhB165]